MNDFFDGKLMTPKKWHFRSSPAHHETQDVESVQRAGGEIRVAGRGGATIHRLYPANARVQSAAAGDCTPMSPASLARRHQIDQSHTHTPTIIIGCL
jgi:hypothetical protein